MTPPEVPKFTDPEPLTLPDVPQDTLGMDALETTNDVLRTRFQASIAEDRIAYAEELQRAKVHPSDGAIRFLAGRLTKKAMSSEEADVVKDARWRNESYVNRKIKDATEGETRLQRSLHAIRMQLRSTDENQEAWMNTYLDTQAPAFIKDGAEAFRGQGMPWSEWLSKEASDEQLVNLLQWNIVQVAERQKDPAFLEAVEEVRHTYTQNVEAAIEAGWFSHEALASLSRVKKVRVEVGDRLSTILRQVRGASVPGEEAVIIAPPETPGQTIAQEVRDVLPHELNHAVLQRLTDGEPLGARWAKEALTELSANAIDRNRDVVTYPYELRLLLTLLTRGSQKVETALATRAYAGGDAEKETLYESLDTSWGVADSLNKVTDFVYRTAEESGSHLHSRREREDVALILAMDALRSKPEVVLGKAHKGSVGRQG